MPSFHCSSFSWCIRFSRRTVPISRRPKRLSAYFDVLKDGDAWWFMLFYGVTFGGFVGLASSLPIYFNDQYGLSPVIAGYCTAACVFFGSLMRPVGGVLADRLGGIRMLSIIYVIAACALVLASFGLPHAGMAVAVFVVGMSALGMGNGSVFQLVPQRFGKEIGMMTGIVGMTGGLGGFYLASSLGYSKQFTGSLSERLPAVCRTGPPGARRADRHQETLAHDLGCRFRQRRTNLRLT